MLFLLSLYMSGIISILMGINFDVNPLKKLSFWSN